MFVLFVFCMLDLYVSNLTCIIVFIQATWSIQLVLLEALIKSNSSIRLFVIDSQTRSIASLVETVEAVMQVWYFEEGVVL